MQADRMTYCFDIDGTLCTDTAGKYLEASPIPHRVAHVNRLYDAGHHIKLFTARGSTTGIDWRKDTAAQLKSWGIKYHELIMGKPFAHVFVDDRAVSAHSYDWQADDHVQVEINTDSGARS